jgi:hypothetical protein
MDLVGRKKNWHTGKLQSLEPTGEICWALCLLHPRLATLLCYVWKWNVAWMFVRSSRFHEPIILCSTLTISLS